MIWDEGMEELTLIRKNSFQLKARNIMQKLLIEKVKILIFLDTRDYKGLVGVAVIPAPTEINAVVISSETDVFSEEVPVVLESE